MFSCRHAIFGVICYAFKVGDGMTFKEKAYLAGITDGGRRCDIEPGTHQCAAAFA